MYLSFTGVGNRKETGTSKICSACWKQAFTILTNRDIIVMNVDVVKTKDKRQGHPVFKLRYLKNFVDCDLHLESCKICTRPHCCIKTNYFELLIWPRPVCLVCLPAHLLTLKRNHWRRIKEESLTFVINAGKLWNVCHLSEAEIPNRYPQ